MESLFHGQKKIRISGDLKIIVAIALSSMISFNFLSTGTNGFVLALDVVVFSIILFLYRESGVMRTSCIAAAASSMFRMLMIYSAGSSLRAAALTALPDASFFLVFGFVYFTMMEICFKRKYDLASFVIAALIGDFTGNMSELLVRSLINGDSAFSQEVLGITTFAAAARTVMSFAVITLADWYTESQVNAERLREYRKLLSNASIIQDEIHIMNKNMAEVEAVMKRGYELYQELDVEGYPEDKVLKMLEIAKLTHEIKGDYRNVITVLSSLYDEELGEGQLSLAEVIRLEQDNAVAHIKDLGLDIEIDSQIGTDAEPGEEYKMMSVIRNLLMNAIEAIADSGQKETGKISISAGEAEVDGRLSCIIDISDNGPGISSNKRDKIFKEGYSSKFDHETGYIQRGLGLSIVKSYVEDDMNGKIELVDDRQKGARFRITVPLEG